MRKLLFAFGLIFSTSSAIAADNYLATQGSGTTFAAKDGGAGLLFPRVIGCDNTTTTQCWTIDSSGRLTVLSNPSTPANWGIGTSTQNSATVANGVLQLGQFNTAPTTITTGNMSPIQLDSAGNLLVNVKAGGAGGGAATVADGADVAEGAKADAAWVSGSGSVIAVLKNIAGGIAASLPAGTSRVGYTSDDPCAQLTKLGAPINLTASGRIIVATAAKKTYICALNLVITNASGAALVEGTGSTCATNIFGLVGGTTAATGWPFSANGGISMGSGAGTVISPSADANGTAADVCLILASPGQTSGHVSYVQQ